MKKSVKLYNVIFPVWFLIFWPPAWLIVLPLNFGIDTLVLYIAGRVMKLGSFKELFRKAILKIWLFGFVADIVGGVLLFAITTIDTARFEAFAGMVDLSHAISWQPFQHPLAVLVILACLFVSGLLIYLLNRHFSFRGLDMTKRQRHWLSLVFAIATAPWMFLIPTSLFY